MRFQKFVQIHKVSKCDKYCRGLRGGGGGPGTAARGGGAGGCAAWRDAHVPDAPRALRAANSGIVRTCFRGFS